MSVKGVAGFSDTAGLIPAWRADEIVDTTSAHASTCTVNISAPASANASQNLDGSLTIMWTSIGRPVAARTDSNTGTPMVMLGTNCPSITSK